MSETEVAPTTEESPADVDFIRRHLRYGWWSLCVFASIGFVLETLHGLKLGFYLDADQETRRLMWTLSHAHGTLLSLVHIALAFTMSKLPDWPNKSRSGASACLIAGSILLPGGFFLGGTFTYDGDPGVSIFVVPIGAALAIVSVARTAMAVGRYYRSE